jgi:hypothetical protein
VLRVTLRRPTGIKKIPDWAAGIHSLSNAQRHSKESFQNLRPVTKTGQPACFFYFTVPFYNDFTIPDGVDDMRTDELKYQEGSGHGLIVELSLHLPRVPEENYKTLLVQPMSWSRFKDSTS